MKYADVVLTVILLLLAAAVLKLASIESALRTPPPQNEQLLASNQALVNSIQRLETQFSGLRQELADFREKVLRK